MTEPITNDTLTLSPRTTFDGPALAFDFPGLLIGVAEYDEGPTGCTVLVFPGPGMAMTSLDLRGGSIGYVGDYPVVSLAAFAIDALAIIFKVGLPPRQPVFEIRILGFNPLQLGSCGNQLGSGRSAHHSGRLGAGFSFENVFDFVVIVFDSAVNLVFVVGIYSLHF